METLSARRRTGGAAKKVARCSKGEGEQAHGIPIEFTADAFLKHRFLPLFQEAATLPPKRCVEQSFFASLATLQQSENIATLNVRDKEYPYNILLSYWDANNQLQRKKQETELQIVETEDGKVAFQSVETSDLGMRLYYIPVLPLFRLMKSRKHHKSSDLLLSVFAYLFRVVGVPYYRDVDSFLYYHYEMLDEMTEDEGLDEKDYLIYHSSFRRAAVFGDIMQRRIYNPCHLELYAKRMANYQSFFPFQDECYRIAKEAYDLWQQFPNGNLYSHICEPLSDKEEEDDYYDSLEYIRTDEQVSFIAETEGTLYDSMAEMINSSFQERSCQEIPSITKIYNKEMTNGDSNLDFERRLFAMLEDLCTLLNDLS